MKCLLIIPAYNESDNIKQVIDSIKRECEFADYIVIDDCSCDNTVKKLQEYNIPYISEPSNLGIGGAVQAGYRYALQYNYDYAVQVDGDGQHDVSYVKDMVKILAKQEADIVIGSRFISNEGFQSSRARRMGISFLSGMIRFLCGQKIRDVTSGFRAVNRNYIELYAKDYPDDYPEPEAIVMALTTGGKIKEIPVLMRERIAGKSSINLRRSVYYMVKVTLAVIIRKISMGVKK